MKALLTILLVGCFSVGASAQEALTKEQTISKISAAVNDIRQTFPTSSPVNTTNAGYIRQKIDEAIKKASALQEDLNSNPYIHVKGFSVGYPSGLTLEFEFVGKG